MKALISVILALVVVHFGLLEYRMQNYITNAYENNVAPLSLTVFSMSLANDSLNDRVDRARTLVAGLVEANHKLKSSLKESVTKVQELRSESDALRAQVDGFAKDLEVMNKAKVALTLKFDNLSKVVYTKDAEIKFLINKIKELEDKLKAAKEYKSC